jgi:hypothetical protein
VIQIPKSLKFLNDSAYASENSSDTDVKDSKKIVSLVDESESDKFHMITWNYKEKIQKYFFLLL